MKKLSIFLILFLIILMTSCTGHITSFNEDTAEEYYEKFYETINSTKVKYAAYDLRTKEEYETSHIKQFQNYDITIGSYEGLIELIKNNYTKKVLIFIYYDDDIELLDIYQLIHSYTNSYTLVQSYSDTLKIAEKYFVIDSGAYDCGC